MQEEVDKTLQAMRALFVPLASLLLKNGLDTGSVVEQLKVAFVEVARNEHGKGDKPASVNRISEITGLSRKYVSSLLDTASKSIVTDELATPIESIILSTWMNSEEYLDDVGRPRALEVGPGVGTFGELVKAVTGRDASNFYLSKLSRANCVAVQVDDRVALTNRVYSIGDDLPRVIAVALVPLATTMARNWGKSIENAFAQRVSHSAHVNSGKIGMLRRIAKERITTFLGEVDDAISNVETDESETCVNAEGREVSRVGVGAYYFEIEKQS